VTASIDYDVENFQVPGGNKTKPYSWPVSTVNVSGSLPGSIFFNLAAINDVIGNSAGTRACSH